MSITSVSIYYRINSDIQVKSYCRLNLHRAFVLNFERLDILWDTIGHPRKKLLSFEIAKSCCSEFRVSRYTMELIGHPSKKLLSFEFAHSFYILFRVTRYIT